MMMDCAKEMLGFHDDEVTLPEPERRDMRERRNANRNRLKNGLKKDGKPGPQEFVTQGSYAMRTMVQRTAKDYDIDDGVYFAQEVLTGPNGGEMSALAARQMVCNALNDGSFKTPPEVRLNCVRVYYDAGYHVDIPVYRCVVTGFDHGVGHSLLLLYDAKAPYSKNSKYFNGLGHHPFNTIYKFIIN